MTPGGSSTEESRRSLLRRLAAGLAGAGLLGAAGCGSSSTSGSEQVTKHSHGAKRDVRLLNRLLGAEYYAIAAYTAAVPLLDGPISAVARQFLGQELLHADRLISLIEQAGGPPNRPLASYDLGRPRHPHAVLALLLLVERVQVSAYLRMIPLLSLGSLQATAASILADQAQHASVWRLNLGQRPAPAAFVTGAELA